MHLSLRKNTTHTTNTTHYYWLFLNNRDISNKCKKIQRNKFDALKEIFETLIPNAE